MPPGQSTPSPSKPKHAAPTPQQLQLATSTLRKLVQVVESDGRYPIDAFRFLEEGLEYAVRRVHGPADQAAPIVPESRHVTGRQLCHALIELATGRWGRLTTAVLASWNIHDTRDFGRMVFLLVENDLLQKNDRDRVEDFDAVVNLTGLERRYQIQCPRPLHAADQEYTPEQTNLLTQSIA